MGCFEDLMDFREEVERLKKDRSAEDDYRRAGFEQAEGEVRE